MTYIEDYVLCQRCQYLLEDQISLSLNVAFDKIRDTLGKSQFFQKLFANFLVSLHTKFLAIFNNLNKLKRNI